MSLVITPQLPLTMDTSRLALLPHSETYTIATESEMLKSKSLLKRSNNRSLRLNQTSLVATYHQVLPSAMRFNPNRLLTYTLWSTRKEGSITRQLILVPAISSDRCSLCGADLKDQLLHEDLFLRCPRRHGGGLPEPRRHQVREEGLV